MTLDIPGLLFACMNRIEREVFPKLRSIFIALRIVNRFPYSQPPPKWCCGGWGWQLQRLLPRPRVPLSN